MTVPDLLARIGWPLGHRGRTVCPLHHGDNPQSFQYGERGWYCHGCGEGGGPQKLVERLLAPAGLVEGLNASGGLSGAFPGPSRSRPYPGHPPWSRILGAACWEQAAERWERAMGDLWTARRAARGLGRRYPEAGDQELEDLLELARHCALGEARALRAADRAVVELRRFARDRP